VFPLVVIVIAAVLLKAVPAMPAGAASWRWGERWSVTPKRAAAVSLRREGTCVDPRYGCEAIALGLHLHGGEDVLALDAYNRARYGARCAKGEKK